MTTLKDSKGEFLISSRDQVIQALLRANKEAMAERDALLAEVKRLRERLQFDPGGSDKIDELEACIQFREHAMREDVRRLLSELQDWTQTYGSALCPPGADTYSEGVRSCKAEVQSIIGRWKMKSTNR